MENKKKILILDDEQDILNILERYFVRKNKVSVTTVSNPLEALKMIENGSYEVLLTDIMMTEMDGIEVLKRVKQLRPEMKVIMMTAYSTIDKILECDKLGATDYVTKPFISLKDVESKILDLLEII